MTNKYVAVVEFEKEMRDIDNMTDIEVAERFVESCLNGSRSNSHARNINVEIIDVSSTSGGDNHDR